MSKPVNDNQETGKTGETIAREHLETAGYRILETNWRFGKDEVDLIARDGEYMVFVEVKTRQSTTFGQPEDSVNKDKQRFLIRAADAYLRKNNIELESRFDIVSVLLTSTSPKINHIREAFYPTMR